MKTSFRDNRASGGYGGKKFGGGSRSAGFSDRGRGYGAGKSYGGPRKGGFNDGPRPDLHDATCSECGAACQVPFKPNGSKPIFCRNCFKRDENAAPKRFDRPAYGDKRPAFKSFGDKPQQAQPDIRKIEARLAAIETKIDALIDALLESDEDGDGDEESEEQK